MPCALALRAGACACGGERQQRCSRSGAAPRLHPALPALLTRPSHPPAPTPAPPPANARRPTPRCRRCWAASPRPWATSPPWPRIWASCRSASPRPRRAPSPRCRCAAAGGAGGGGGRQLGGAAGAVPAGGVGAGPAQGPLAASGALALRACGGVTQGRSHVRTRLAHAAPTPPNCPSPAPQAIYVPADDLTDPAPATTFAHLDATTVLSRGIAGAPAWGGGRDGHGHDGHGMGMGVA